MEGNTYSSKEKNPPRDIMSLNIYAPNTKAPKFIKETLLKVKSHTNSNTVIVGDFNTPLLPDSSIKTKTTRKCWS